MNPTITDIRSIESTAGSAPLHASRPGPATGKIRPLFPERTTQAPQRRRTLENWLIVVMIASTCAFAGTLAVYVVYPAISALTTSGNSWAPEGP